MEFNYTEEQLALQDTLQRFISRDYDFDKRRAFSKSELGYSAEAWKQYAELGLLALPFPEEFGGLGGNAVDVMLVMEQFGAGLLLEPYLSTVVACGGLMRDAASDALKQKLLPQIAAGTLQVGAGRPTRPPGATICRMSHCTARAKRRRLDACPASKTVVLDGAVRRLLPGIGAQRRQESATATAYRCSWCRATPRG